jgi:DNA-binding SARP family transcriptional activator/predicted ATPase/Flp pilus assembly protein TadD
MINNFPHLILTFLGSFHGSLDGRPLTQFRSAKVRALLAYLTVEGNRPHSRSTLAGLFWPEMPEREARRNLTQTLVRLNKTIHNQDASPPFLKLTGQTISFNQQSHYQLDVERFVRLSAGRNLVELETAVSLYQGEFLAGFSLAGCVAFDEWLLLEREYLERLALENLHKLTNSYLQSEQYQDAKRTAGRQLAIDPLRELAHRQLMRALALNGQRSAALAQYERCRQILESELAVEPQPATSLLHQQIRAGAFDHLDLAGPLPLSRLAQPQLPTNLPGQFTSFIGREKLLQEVLARVRQGDSRLVCLLGPGGIGKTRLAVAAAEKLRLSEGERFSDGVWFIPFQAVPPDPEQLSRMAAETGLAIGLRFAGKRPPREELSSFLRDKAALLVIDNIEHLPAASDFIEFLLAASPRLSVLVTSRSRLPLDGGSQLELPGLDVPNTVGPEAENGDSTSRPAASVELFISRARRSRLDFALTAANLNHIEQICRQLSGLPLAIELAANWVTHFRISEIAEAIQKNIDFLSTVRQDTPTRQKSLRAVFEYSWQLLTAGEQAVLAQCAIIQGNFSREAALAVTGAGLSDLVALTDHFLLNQPAVGRYNMHSLLRQFINEKLPSGLQESGVLTAEQYRQCTRLHSEFYLQFVEQRSDFLRGSTPQVTAAELLQEQDNIRQAWVWATANQALPQLEAALSGLMNLYGLMGLYQERVFLLQQTMDTLTAQIDPQTQEEAGWQRFFGRISVDQARSYYHTGHTEQAADCAETGLIYARKVGDTATLVLGYLELGRIALTRTDYESAGRYCQTALELAGPVGRPLLEADVLHNLGRVNYYQGHYREAAELFAKALSLCRESDDHRGQGGLHNAVGLIAKAQGNLATAYHEFDQALQLCRTCEDWIGASDAANNLGATCLEQGDYGRAKSNLEQALAFHQHIDARLGKSHVLNNLGALLAAYGDYAGAQQYLEQALIIRQELGATRGIDLVKVNLGAIAHYRGDAALARQHLEEARDSCLKTGSRLLAGYALNYLGDVYLATNLPEQAKATFLQGLALRRELGQAHLAAESEAGLARTALAQNQTAEARDHVTEILDYLHGHTIEGMEDPILVYLTCYRVLAATGDSQAPGILETAYNLLQQRAAPISDPALRHSFLDKVASHRAVVLARNNA